MHMSLHASLEKAERFLKSVDAKRMSKGVGASIPSPPRAADHILRLLRRLRVSRSDTNEQHTLETQCTGHVPIAMSSVGDGPSAR